MNLFRRLLAWERRVHAATVQAIIDHLDRVALRLQQHSCKHKTAGPNLYVCLKCGLDLYWEFTPRVGVLCFRRLRGGDGERRGVWVMVENRKGAFFHGDRRTIDTPRYSVDELADMTNPDEDCFTVEPISHAVALAELESWPDGQAEAKRILEKYEKIATLDAQRPDVG